MSNWLTEALGLPEPDGSADYRKLFEVAMRSRFRMWKAIRDLKAENEKLQARIVELEQQNELLEDKVENMSWRLNE